MKQFVIKDSTFQVITTCWGQGGGSAAAILWCYYQEWDKYFYIPPSFNATTNFPDA